MCKVEGMMTLTDCGWKRLASSILAIGSGC